MNTKLVDKWRPILEYTSNDISVLDEEKYESVASTMELYESKFKENPEMWKDILFFLRKDEGVSLFGNDKNLISKIITGLQIV